MLDKLPEPAVTIDGDTKTVVSYEVEEKDEEKKIKKVSLLDFVLKHSHQH